ncbi:hypothetical protein [Shewanella woodyi]|uniref:hypothetical protein n=1 Tax=Shewanella woodyi TaxID=60961 RepID=UPI003749304B
MLVVTNYPNVPIATTNAATDAARTDNLQRPPVIPPQEMTKGHEERPFTPQHERTAQHADVLARLNEKSQGKQQGTGQQQEDTKQQQQQAKPQQALMVKDLLKGKPALQRRDIRNNQYEMSANRNEGGKETRTQVLDQPSEVYQMFGQHIEAFYQRQTEPVTQSAISAFI